MEKKEKLNESITQARKKLREELEKAKKIILEASVGLDLYLEGLMIK